MRSLDDHTRSISRAKYCDKMAKMNHGAVDVFAVLFAFACPTFIATNEIIQSTGSGEYAADPSLSFNPEADKKQLAAFMEEVQQRAPLPKLKSYLRLYTTIPVQKLAQMMEVTEDELKKNLEVMQEKSSNVIEYRREYCKSLLDGVEVSKLNASSGGAAAHWNTFDALDIALDEDKMSSKTFGCRDRAFEKSFPCLTSEAMSARTFFKFSLSHCSSITSSDSTNGIPESNIVAS